MPWQRIRAACLADAQDTLATLVSRGATVATDLAKLNLSHAHVRHFRDAACLPGDAAQ